MRNASTIFLQLHLSHVFTTVMMLAFFCFMDFDACLLYKVGRGICLLVVTNIYRIFQGTYIQMAFDGLIVVELP